MSTLNWLDLSAVLGLGACGLLTLNFMMGILLSTGYKSQALWKRLPDRIRSISLDRLHEWTAYLAIALTFLHLIFYSWISKQVLRFLF